jgi:hypothetical protein
MLNLENWARAAGFAALLAVALGGTVLFAYLDYLPDWYPAEQVFADCRRPSSHGTATVEHEVPPGDPKTASDQAQKHMYECLVAEFTRHLVFFTKWLVIVTGFLVLATMGLLVATWNAAKRAERAISAVESAWIFASPDFTAAWSENPPPKLRICVKNQGRTPGLIVRYHMEFRKDPPQGDEPEYGDVDDNKTVWPCGPADSYYPIPHGFDWDQQCKIAVGFIEYETVFGTKTKKTHFCYDLKTRKEIRPAGSPAYNRFRAEDD